MATTVASPLERHLGQIADVTEMTSSSLGRRSTRITLQFGLNRDIDGAARDVQAAINAARADLPTSLRSNPTYRKVNPADAPILILTLDFGHAVARRALRCGHRPCWRRSCRRSTASARSAVGGSSLPAVRVELDPAGALQIRHRPRGRARGARQRQRPQPEGRHRRRRSALPDLRQRPGQQGRRLPVAGRRLSQRRAGASVRCRRGHRLRREPAQCRPRQRQAGGADHPLPAARRQHHRHGRPREGADAATAGVDFARDRRRNWRSTARPPSAPRCAMSSARWCWPCCW